MPLWRHHHFRVIFSMKTAQGNVLNSSHVPLPSFGCVPAAAITASIRSVHSGPCMVTSKLDYWNVLNLGLYWKMVWKLQLVQNMVAHVVTGSQWFDLCHCTGNYTAC